MLREWSAWLAAIGGVSLLLGLLVLKQGNNRESEDDVVSEMLSAGFVSTRINMGVSRDKLLRTSTDQMEGESLRALFEAVKEDDWTQRRICKLPPKYRDGDPRSVDAGYELEMNL